MFTPFIPDVFNLWVDSNVDSSPVREPTWSRWTKVTDIRVGKM